MPVLVSRILAAGAILGALRLAFPHEFSDEDGARRLAFAGVALLASLGIAALARLWRGRLAAAALVWAAVFAAIVGGYSWRAELSAAYDRALGRQAPLVALARAGGEVELTRTWDGHFRAPVVVNGREDAPLPMLIDTGASIVLLRHEDAEAVGIDTRRLRYSTAITTANGGARVAPVTLESLRVGDVELHNVRAAVAERGALHSPLLGMSFLAGLSELTFRGDKALLKR